MTDDLVDIERRVRELNEAIAQVGWSMQEVSDTVQELRHEIHPTTHPQYQVAIFAW